MLMVVPNGYHNKILEISQNKAGTVSCSLQLNCSQKIKLFLQKHNIFFSKVHSKYGDLV